jgi:uncharacterized protein
VDLLRNQLRKNIDEALNDSPICLLLGARQSGKTHMATQLSPKQENFFDLENMVDQTRLEENPQGELARLFGLVVIDEAQRLPAIFPVLRYLADRPGIPARFLLLGSASPHLMRGAGESLAGRVKYVEMGGFNVAEIDPPLHEQLWLQGGLPPSFLKEEPQSFNWRLDYLRSLIEQDLRKIAESRLPPATLRRLLLLLAQSHGKPWNASEAARILSIDSKTVQRHVDLFEGAFLLRLVPPFHTNIKKRLRKAPTLYFKDSGLLHALLGIRSQKELRSHREYGFSWEGFALEQVIRVLGLRESECFTYSVHSGDEMDLVVERGGIRYGFEFKATDSPTTTDSMRNSIRDLGLERVWVVHPGDRDYSLSDRINAVAARNLLRLGLHWDQNTNDPLPQTIGKGTQEHQS